VHVKNEWETKGLTAVHALLLDGVQVGDWEAGPSPWGMVHAHLQGTGLGFASTVYSTFRHPSVSLG